ncbi:unnamed protein product, partial [Brassica rapa subsp. trilocularis]
RHRKNRTSTGKRHHLPPESEKKHDQTPPWRPKPLQISNHGSTLQETSIICDRSKKSTWILRLRVDWAKKY